MNTSANDFAARLTEFVRDQSFPNSQPRDASTLIVIDRAGPTSKVLLGRRHAGHKFMPGKFVFPGGRVEPRDRFASYASPLDPIVEARLMDRIRRPNAARARAFAVAALRETFEETGLLIGRKQPGAPAKSSRTANDPFADAGVLPDLGALHFVVRAITPPRRPRRFDTRFFTADAESIAHRVDGIVGPDAELVELVWLPIAEAMQLDIPAITQVALQELEARIAAGLGHALPVPFYRMINGRFRREIL